MTKYLINEPHDKLKPGFVSGRVVRLRNQLLFHKNLLTVILLYLLKFYTWKKQEDDENKGIDENELEKKQQNPIIKMLRKKQNELKSSLFRVYRYLLEGQKPPVLYKEYILKYYPGGDDFQSWLDFIRGIFVDLEHPYRSSDLNFKIRMISHDKPT